METILVRTQIAAPVARVWQALAAVCSDEAVWTTATTEVLGGQPPTILSFRLLTGAPVRRNVVAVQLRPVPSGTTEVWIDSAFQPSPAGAAGRARRRMRRLLSELAMRLEDTVRTSNSGALDRTVSPPLLHQLPEGA